MRSIAAYPGIGVLSGAELAALARTADRVGTEVDDLGAVIGFESGFDPQAVNPYSGCAGILQWCSPEAVGTTRAALLAMSFREQLPFVERYFAPFRGRLGSLENTYLAVFWPRALAYSDDDVIASRGSDVYDQNPSFDVQKRGYFTRGDILRTIRAYAARATGRLQIPDTSSPPWDLFLTVFAGAFAFWYAKKHGGRFLRARVGARLRML